MLVHAPKLVNGAKIGEGFDARFVPPVSLALRVQGILMVQLAVIN